MAYLPIGVNDAVREGNPPDDIGVNDAVREGNPPDDFTTDVLSSARKSLAQATPRSQVQKGHKRAYCSLTDEEFSDEDKPHPIKLQLSSEED